jgi:hypothetical protein
MSNRTRSVSRWALGAVVLGVLAFGAEQAAAEPSELTCQDDGWNFLGQQPSYEACYDACFALHGQDLQQALWGPAGCCRCLF